MASIIGLLVLFLATLTLGGCAGMPNYGYGYGNGASGYGSGGSYPQAYGGGIPIPGIADPYAAGYGAAGAYAQQYGQQYAQPYGQPYDQQYGQPYASNYYGAPGMQDGQYADPTASRRIDQRERQEAARIRQGVRDGSITPEEAQRLWAEQRRIRGAEGRMRADGNLDPRERARLNNMLDRGGRDIYRARHNDAGQPGDPRTATQPGGPGPWARHRGGPGTVVQPGDTGTVARPNISRGQMQSPMQSQVRPMQQQVRPMQPQVRPMQPANAPRVQPAQPGNNMRVRRMATSQ